MWVQLNKEKLECDSCDFRLKKFLKQDKKLNHKRKARLKLRSIFQKSLIHKIRKGLVYEIGKQLYISKKKTNNPVKMGKTSKKTF